MIVGAYNLHLYCDSSSHQKNGGENNPIEFGEYQTKEQAYRAARREGWSLIRGIAICPDCNPKKIKMFRK